MLYSNASRRSTCSNVLYVMLVLFIYIYALCFFYISVKCLFTSSVLWIGMRWVNFRENNFRPKIPKFWFYWHPSKKGLTGQIFRPIQLKTIRTITLTLSPHSPLHTDSDLGRGGCSWKSQGTRRWRGWQFQYGGWQRRWATTWWQRSLNL